MAGQGPLTNRVLGGTYLLGELLGQGGFGAVYKAQHQRLNRSQAVKVLAEQHFNNPQFRARFIREAQTLAALDHPNILHVDELGEEGNLIYLVMPYISRGTLQDLLKQRGPLPPDEAGRYLEQICAGLRYAHKRGVVHLDLKPLNLLVHEDGRLLLSDFGLAHLIKEGAVQGGASLTFGTPFYMAPEHLRGQPDWRSDLYSLGVILFQMLAGRLPFEGPTPESIIARLLTEPAPPLRQFRPDLPPALEWMVAKALTKRPEDRYQKASEFLYYFREALAPRPAGSLRPSTPIAPAHLPPTVAVKRPSVPVAPGPAPAPSGLLGNYAPTVAPYPPAPYPGPVYPAVPVAPQKAPGKAAMNGRTLAIGGLLCLFAFILPWLTFSTASAKRDIGGAELASAGTANWFWLELLAGVTLLFAGALLRRTGKNALYVSLGASILGIIVLLLFLITVQILSHNTDVKVTVNLGFYLALIGYITALVGTIRRLLRR